MRVTIDGPPHQDRPDQVWSRQLVKKWRSLKDTKNHAFNRDDEMDEENGYDSNDERRGYTESAKDFEELIGEKMNGVDNRIRDLHLDVDLDAVADAKPSVSLLRGQSEKLHQQFVVDHEYRVGVHTWNVAGKPPPDDLDLEDWIDVSDPADIYVFGFQEIVPLNASNVLSVEDGGPAMKWEANIREFLNTRIGPKRETKLARTRSLPSSYSSRDHVDIIPVNVPEVSNVKKLLGSCLGEEVLMSSTFRAAELNLLNQLGVNYKTELFTILPGLPSTTEAAPILPLDDYSWPFARNAPTATAMADEPVPEAAHLKFADSLSFSDDMEPYPYVHQQYSRVASKQMVGLFITVWIRSDLWRHVHNVQVSAVGCGLMNYLGNKGSISVSMSLHQTSFCFVNSHLTSGHNKGDELKRNSDVTEILRRTKFPRLVKLLGLGLPETILAHDRVIWLGDLNYRLSLSELETWKLVKLSDWESLIKLDELDPLNRGLRPVTGLRAMVITWGQPQLKLEQDEGRVFVNWKEGPIHFPPTYKFMDGSDEYAGEATGQAGEKRRSPAWCDRVLWYGDRMRQVAYRHGDSRLSDHRSVSAIFLAEVDVVNSNKLRRACVLPKEVGKDLVAKAVVPRVAPIIDVEKLQNNEVWSTILKHTLPGRLRRYWSTNSRQIQTVRSQFSDNESDLDSDRLTDSEATTEVAKQAHGDHQARRAADVKSCKTETWCQRPEDHHLRPTQSMPIVSQYPPIH